MDTSSKTTALTFVITVVAAGTTVDTVMCPPVPINRQSLVVYSTTNICPPFAVNPGAGFGHLLDLHSKIASVKDSTINMEGVEAPSQASIESAVATAAELAAFDLSLQHVVASAEGGIGLIYEVSTDKYAGVECLNDRSIVATVTDRKQYVESWLVGKPDGITFQEVANHFTRLLNARAA